MKIGRYIVGLISGVTFGMLFAPRKGTELRKELFDKGSESGAEGLKVLGGAFRDAGDDVMKELKGLSENEQIAAFLDMSHEKMKGFLEAAEEKGYDVAAVVQEKLETFTEMAKGKFNNIQTKVQDKCDAVAVKPVKAKKNSPFIQRKVELKNEVKEVKKAIVKKIKHHKAKKSSAK
jgi:gas vesicle protein